MNNSKLTHLQVVPMAQLKQIKDLLKIDPETVSKLDIQVDDFLKNLAELEVSSPEFKKKIDVLYNVGFSSLKKSTRLSHRLLSRSLNYISNDSKNQNVSYNLNELRQLLESLDPENNHKFFRVRKFLGLLPLKAKVDHYFDKFKVSLDKINKLLMGLEDGRDHLTKENIAIERDKLVMLDTLKEIEQYIYIAEELTKKTEYLILGFSSSNVIKARTLEYEIITLLKRKTTDLLAQQTVSIQSYMTLELIQRNNIDLIKSLDRTLLHTVSALHTAILIANSLSNKKLILDQVIMLKNTTENIFNTTSSLFNQNRSDKQKKTMRHIEDMEELHKEFKIIYDIIGNLDNLKNKSLLNLRK